MRTTLRLSALRSDYGIGDAAVACGVFDGMHRGHKCVIEALLALAAEQGAEPVVVTFEPHPRTILRPGQAPALLTVREQKLRLLDELGVAAVVLLPFSRDMAALEPDQFLRDHLLSPHVRVHGICVGAGWRFGVGGRGDVDLLRRVGVESGFAMRSVPEFDLYGLPVSSTRIRTAVSRGRLDHAARLLGRRYSVYGHVAHGRGLGKHEFHCPTANLTDEQIILPPAGTYAAHAFLDVEDRCRHDAVVYVGTAPTIEGSSTTPATPVLEVHLFNFHEDLYGAAMEVAFLEFIRPDRRFKSHAALGRQIRKDIAAAGRVLGIKGADGT